MTVKQISLITMKSGEKVNLPDALNEAEICFTTDTGEVFIGAPNFGPVQYRSDEATNSNGQGISPYRNIKILTELDVTQAITGQYYTQGPLVNSVIPLTTTPYTVYTFDQGINSAVVSFSLYDGSNVNLVGDIYICTFGGDVTVCMAGMRDPGIVFSGIINSSGQIVLQTTNTTSSQYTIYLSAKCWESSLATWDGTKGEGVSPTCYAGNGDGSGGGNGTYYLSKLKDVELSPLSDKQFLSYNAADQMWENVTIDYSDITGTPPAGQNYLKDLLDVQLTSLTDGQILVYNAADQKWENGPPPPSVAKWTVSNGVTATGTTSSDAAVIDTTDNVIPIVSAPPVQNSAITGYSVSNNNYTLCPFLQNVGVVYTGKYKTSSTNGYNVTLYNLPLPGGSGSGAVAVAVPVCVTPMPYACVFTGTTSYFSSPSNTIYIGGTANINIIDTHTISNISTGATYKYHDDSLSLNYLGPYGSASFNITSSTTNTINFTFNVLPGNQQIGFLTTSTFALNTDIPVYIKQTDVVTATGGSIQWNETKVVKIGTLQIQSFSYYNCFGKKVGDSSIIGSSTSSVQGGSGYVNGDQLTLTLDGTPETTYVPVLTVNGVTTTNPTGIKMTPRDVGSMVIVNNGTGNDVVIYPEDGSKLNTTAGSFLLEGSKTEAKLVRTSDTNWFVYST